MVVRNELVNLEPAKHPDRDGDAFSLETNQWRPVDVGQVGDVSSQTFADPFIVALLRKDELTAGGMPSGIQNGSATLQAGPRTG